MAKPVSEEELQLKKRARRRLIGAIALVAAVAAVLPMVLDSEPKSGPQEINIQIPTPEPKGAVVSKVTPPAARSGKDTPARAEASASEAGSAEKPAAKAPETPAAKAEAKVAASAAAGDPAKAAANVPDNPNDIALSRAPRAVQDKAAAKTSDKSADKVPDKAPDKAAEKPAPKAAEKAVERTAEKPVDKAQEKTADKTPAPKAGPGAFFIQVIALTEAQKAKQVQQQIAGAGVRAYTEVVNSGAGAVTRVRAGPFATREEADKAQAKLQGIGLDGKVAAY